MRANQDVRFSLSLGGGDTPNTWDHQWQVDNKVRHFFCRSILLAYPFSLIAQAGSVWTCLVIALDRFIAVFLPVQKRVWATPRTSTIFICGVALFAIVIQKVREAYRTLKQPMHSNTTRRR